MATLSGGFFSGGAAATLTARADGSTRVAHANLVSVRYSLDDGATWLGPVSASGGEVILPTSPGDSVLIDPVGYLGTQVPGYLLDTTTLAGSLQFPSGNGRVGSYGLGQMGAIWQPSAVITLTLTGVVFYAELGLDLRKRICRSADFAYADYFEIMGNGWGPGQTFGVRLRDANATTNPNCFEIRYLGGGGTTVSMVSPEWTEPECALFARVVRSGSNKIWEFGWIGRDGTVHSTTETINSVSISEPVGGGYGIGAILASDAAITADGGGTGAGLRWPGRIGRMVRTGYDGVDTDNIDPTTVADLVGLYVDGDDVADLAATSSGNLRYYRDFGLGLDAPFDYQTGAAQLEDRGTAYVSGAETTRKGTGFTGTTGSNLRITSPAVDGTFCAVLPSQSTAPLEVTVDAEGYEGETIQVRAFYPDGTWATEYVDLGVVTDGVASGVITLPLSRGGGYFLQAQRLDGAASVTSFDRIYVGYAIGLLGQSQCDNAMTGSLQGYTDALETAGNAVFVTNDWQDDDNATSSVYPGADRANRIGVVDDYWTNHGPIRAFINQMARFTDAPICLVDLAVKETGRALLYADDGTNTAAGTGSRSWAQLRDKIDLLGGRLSAVVDQWVTSDMARSTYADMIEELFHGGTPLGGENSLSDILEGGFAYAYNPPTRHVWTQATDSSDNLYITNTNARRNEGVARAQDLGLTVGPPSCDYKIEAAGGPHADSADVMGSPLLMARAAIGAARALGLDGSQNPYWSTDVVRAGNKITITPVLPNGGTLTSPAPAALRSWSVDASYAGFTATMTDGVVVLTKDSGDWSGGEVIALNPNGQGRAAGDATDETAIVAGFCYETWGQDILGRGLPVTGRMEGGQWYPDFHATAA